MPAGRIPDHVYFARSTLPRVKIGCSHDPAKRAKQLSGDRYGRVSIISATAGKIDLERMLHLKFRAIRMDGEWFQPTPELLAFADRIALDAESAVAEVRAEFSHLLNGPWWVAQFDQVELADACARVTTALRGHRLRIVDIAKATGLDRYTTHGAVDSLRSVKRIALDGRSYRLVRQAPSTFGLRSVGL